MPIKMIITATSPEYFDDMITMLELLQKRHTEAKIEAVIRTNKVFNPCNTPIMGYEKRIKFGTETKGEEQNGDKSG